MKTYYFIKRNGKTYWSFDFNKETMFWIQPELNEPYDSFFDIHSWPVHMLHIIESELIIREIKKGKDF